MPEGDKRKTKGEEVAKRRKQHDGMSVESSSPPSSSTSAPSASSLFDQFQALSAEEQQEFLKLQHQNSVILKEQEAGIVTPTRSLVEVSHQTHLSPKSDSDRSINSTPNRFRRDFSSSERVSKYVVTELKQDGIFHKYTSERVGTNVSGADGDHITALAVLKEIVYNFLEGKSYDEMSKELPNLLNVVGIQSAESKEEESSTIEGTIIDTLQERERFLKNNNLTLERDTRKTGLTKGLNKDSLLLKLYKVRIFRR